MADLNGDLLPPNEYGTSRVSAGAYASLDPGWGPDDFRTWIITRSPYVQGLTTFGNAAVGQKIEGEIVRSICEPYEFINPKTGEVMRLQHTWGYQPHQNAEVIGHTQVNPYQLVG
jgi:hypothetical protein